MTRRITGLWLLLLIVLAEYQTTAVHIDHGRTLHRRLQRHNNHRGDLSAHNSVDALLSATARLRPDETRHLTLMRDIISKVLELSAGSSAGNKPDDTVELFDDLLSMTTGTPMSSPTLEPVQFELIALAEKALTQAKAAFGSNKDAASALTFAEALVTTLKKAAAAKSWSEALGAEVMETLETTAVALDPNDQRGDAHDSTHLDLLPLKPGPTLDLHDRFGIAMPQLIAAKSMFVELTAHVQRHAHRDRDGASVGNPCGEGAGFLMTAAVMLVLSYVGNRFVEIDLTVVVVTALVVLFASCWYFRMRQRANTGHSHAHLQSDKPSSSSGKSTTTDTPPSTAAVASSSSVKTVKKRFAKVPAPIPTHTAGELYYPVSIRIPFHGSAVVVDVPQNVNGGCFIRVFTDGRVTPLDGTAIAELQRCAELATELYTVPPLNLNAAWIASFQYHTGAAIAFGGNLPANTIAAPAQAAMVGILHPGGDYSREEIHQRTGLKPFVITLNPLTHVTARLRRRLNGQPTYHGGHGASKSCYLGPTAQVLNDGLVAGCALTTLREALTGAYVFGAADAISHVPPAQLQGVVQLEIKEPYPVDVITYNAATGARNAAVTVYVKHDACTGLNQACLNAIAAAPTFPPGTVLLPNGHSPMAYKNPHNAATYTTGLTWGVANTVTAQELANANPSLAVEVFRTLPGVAAPYTASQIHFPGTRATAVIAARHHISLGYGPVDNLRIDTRAGGVGAWSEHVFYLNCASGRFDDATVLTRNTARAAAVTAMQVASGAASVNVMTPNGLFGNINDAGTVGTPSRTLKESLEVAHGLSNKHFGYVYAEMDVQVIGLLPLDPALRPVKIIGWMCAADNRLAGPINPLTAKGAGVHTEQRCLEQMRRFIKDLEWEAGGSASATRQVTGIRTRWFTDYTPDNSDTQNCAWALSFTRFAAQSGRWLDAEGEYDETVRQQAAKTQAGCTARLGGGTVAARVITWANPVAHCTYRDMGANNQKACRTAAHAAALAAHTPGNVPTAVQETAHTPLPAGSAGPWTTVVWPLPP